MGFRPISASPISANWAGYFFLRISAEGSLNAALINLLASIQADSFRRIIFAVEITAIEISTALEQPSFDSVAVTFDSTTLTWDAEP
jgi:hypothetical protein